MIDVKFEQVNVDMDNENHEKRVEYKTFEARPCTKEDFQADVEEVEAKKKNKEVWEKFKN